MQFNISSLIFLFCNSSCGKSASTEIETNYYQPALEVQPIVESETCESNGEVEAERDYRSYFAPIISETVNLSFYEPRSQPEIYFSDASAIPDIFVTTNYGSSAMKIKSTGEIAWKFSGDFRIVFGTENVEDLVVSGVARTGEKGVFYLDIMTGEVRRHFDFPQWFIETALVVSENTILAYQFMLDSNKTRTVKISLIDTRLRLKLL